METGEFRTMGRENLRTIALEMGGFSWEYESSELLLRRRGGELRTEPLCYLQNSSKVRKCCSGYISALAFYMGVHFWFFSSCLNLLSLNMGRVYHRNHCTGGGGGGGRTINLIDEAQKTHLSD
jgi:hypothetical protein